MVVTIQQGILCEEQGVEQGNEEMEMFWILVGMVVTWDWTFVKTQQTVYLKSAHTLVCKKISHFL